MRISPNRTSPSTNWDFEQTTTVLPCRAAKAGSPPEYVHSGMNTLQQVVGMFMLPQEGPIDIYIYIISIYIIYIYIISIYIYIIYYIHY